MSIYQAVVLAIVQGVTEFLPISSSAHLALAPWLFGWEDQGLTFDIALHFGTLAAVLLYFFRDWIQIIAQGFGLSASYKPELENNRRLLWLLAAGTIPVAVAGLLLKKHVETTLRNPLVIGFMLISVGLLMAVADRVGKRLRDVDTIKLGDCLAVGAAQALSVVPGTSRSGITITAGLFRGFDRHAAARFSFLLATPAIGGAWVDSLLELASHGGIPEGTGVLFAVGMVTSAITGCLVISFFLRFLKSNSLKFFIYYRVIFGIIIIALALFRPVTE